jgi:hypothetical protein
MYIGIDGRTDKMIAITAASAEQSCSPNVF